jgi:membrane-associated phospholipid phosphatase
VNILAERIKTKWSEYFRKYKHGLVIVIYSILYLLLFSYLEQRKVYGYHVVHTVFDDMIPFCEFFVVPYLLWFPYMIAAVWYFIFKNKNKREYYQLTLNLMMGMTVFLIVSYVYPNVQHLRPAIFPRENVFTNIVRWLYRTDTPTNILPSIHVFNSLAVYMSLSNCEALRDRKFIRYGSLILTILIIMSTMFLKQHSVIDVCLGATLALFGYLFFYPQQIQEHAREKTPAIAGNERWKRHE